MDECDIVKQIEKKVSLLTEKEFQRPSMTVNQFIEEMSGTLSQARTDREMLVKSGFDWKLMTEYQKCFEMMTEACCERTTALLDTPKAKKNFDQEMKTAKEERAFLKVVASSIVKYTDDESLRQSYREAVKGNSRIKVLVCNLDLVSMIGDYPRIAAQVRPGGRVADSKFLKSASDRAVRLLKTRGLVIRNGSPVNEAVNRKNSLITLCLRAQSKIKEAARTAFFNDLEYYRRHYCSPVRRARNKKRYRKYQLPAYTAPRN